MKSHRWAWADIGKGIAIILVVITHTGEGILNAGIGLREALWTNFHDICYTFIVPVFFLLSGWFSQISSKGPMMRAKSLGTNIIYPYVLWSFLQTSLMILTAAGNKVPTWNDLLSILLNGSMQFWFLHCLILILLIDLILRIFSVPVWIRLCGLLCVTAVAVLGFNFPWRLDAVARHIIYFEIGVLLATVALLKLSLNIYGMAISGAVLLVTLYFSDAGYGTNLRPLGAFSGILLTLATSSLIARSRNFVSISLETCGKFSLQIYVLHVIFAAGLRVFLAKVGVDEFWIHLILGSVVGVVAPIILAYFDEHSFDALFRFPDLRRITSGDQPLTCHESKDEP